MEFLLNSMRKIDNDQVKEHAFGTEESLEERLARCFVNPKDFEKLNLVASLHLKISNSESSIIVSVEKNEKVQEACAIGIPHPKRGEAAKVFLVLKAGQTASEEEMLAYPQEKLAKYKWPLEIEFRDDLPKSAVGKILRKELRAEELAKLKNQ